MYFNYYKRCLLDFISPRECIVCRRGLDMEEVFLCVDCLADMPLTYYWSWRENPAEKILWARTYLETVSALCFYTREGEYKALIHNVKYKGGIFLAEYLGAMLGEYLKDSPCPSLDGMSTFSKEIDYIIPIPLHIFKKFKRGYNQAEMVAIGLGETLEKEVVIDVLLRREYNSSQTKVTMGAKWENIRDSFVVNNSERLEGKHILLVDDVLTSGATVEACCDKLSKINNIKLSFATLAYVE